MQAILTNGWTIYDRLEAPLVDPDQLNAPLRAARFSVEGGCLAWVPECPARAALPVAALRQRARVAHEVERARVAHQERLLAVREVETQHSELVRLARQVLSEAIPPEVISAPPDPLAIWATDVTACVDSLTFRVHLYGSSGYVLEVSLSCPVCRDVAWHRVDNLSGLGALLRQLEDGSHAQECATCRAITELASCDDPFASE